MSERSGDQPDTINIRMSVVPPGSTRLIGRPRRHTRADVPTRLAHWHAPRANRWERLRVLTGQLDTEWLEPAHITTLRLRAGQSHWIAPGSRWRMAWLDADAAFELEVHADEAMPAAAPQPVRAALLETLSCRDVTSALQLVPLLDTIAAGTLVLVQAGFDFTPALHAAPIQAAGSLFWHPLEARSNDCSVLIGHTAAPVKLANYMGRDHAVIEAALAGALRGRAQYARWLDNTLSRHLAIEEQILFPAWLAAGGDKRLVDGLRNEHSQLRQQLPRLDEAVFRRRFLLLDGHDEKEEQIIYPDIAARVVDADTTLLHVILRHTPIPGLP
jgi:tellurite resistance-related uncharacterized protein